MMRLSLTVLCAAACFLLCIPASEAISWWYDFDNAVKEARTGGKPVMIDFYTDWCGWCKKLDKDTYTDRTVNELAEDFICVKINADKSPYLATKYGVRGYPTIVFLNAKGGVEEQIVGYAGADKFAQVMNAVLRNVGHPHEIKKEKPKAAPKDRFRLGGIIRNVKGKKAVINDKMVGVGDVIDGARVTDISTTSVKLSFIDKEIVLKMDK